MENVNSECCCDHCTVHTVLLYVSIHMHMYGEQAVGGAGQRSLRTAILCEIANLCSSEALDESHQSPHLLVFLCEFLQALAVGGAEVVDGGQLRRLEDPVVASFSRLLL
jgi:hypothetical protein